MTFITYIINEYTFIAPFEKRLGVEELAFVIINFDSDGSRYDEMVNALVSKVYYTYEPKKKVLNQINRETPPVKPFIEKPLV